VENAGTAIKRRQFNTQRFDHRQQQQRRVGNSGVNSDSDHVTTSAASETASADAAAPDDCCEVCMLAPGEGFALVPCGHSRFCESCALRVADLASGVGMSCWETDKILPDIIPQTKSPTLVQNAPLLWMI